MTSPKKNASRATTVKGKSVAAGGTGTVYPPPHLDIPIKDSDKEHSFPATTPEVGANQLEMRLSAEGQLLQMLV